MSQSPSLRQRARRVLAPIPGAVPLVRLIVETVGLCLKYRVTGLAAEAGFFMLLSLPPLLLGLIAGVGFIGGAIGPGATDTVVRAIEQWSSRFLTDESVASVIVPTVQETLGTGRADLLSIGFVLSLWSGSRALHVFMDTISIMYGQSGIRGIVGSRAMSLALYAASVLAMAVTLPLVLIGPTYLQRWLPEPVQFLVDLYWPVVGLLGLLSITFLYHFATPQRSPFLRDLPGAVIAVLIWVGASAVLRRWADTSVGGSSVYGPLSAPIVLLIWLYFMAIAVLIGAALNASIRRLWPPPEYRGPIVRANEWWELRRGAKGETQPLTPLARPRANARAARFGAAGIRGLMFRDAPGDEPGGRRT